VVKLSSYKLLPKLKEKYINEFYEAIFESSDLEDLKGFGNHLFTPTEIEAFAKRIAILKRLRTGLSYWEIKDEVKVTNATITKMANILQKANQKFVETFDDLIKEENKQERRKKDKLYVKGSKQLYAKRLSK